MKSTEQVKKLRDMSVDELDHAGRRHERTDVPAAFSVGDGTDRIFEENARASQRASPVGDDPSREGKGKIENG